MTEDSAGVSGNVLGNDTDVDPGTTLTATLDASPSNGTVTLAPNGTFSYTPAPDFNGTDSFTYTAGDGTAVSNRRDGDDRGHRRQRRAGRGHRHGVDDGRDRGQRLRARQ